MRVMMASLLIIGMATAGNAADQTSLQVPQSVRLQHDQIVSRLMTYTKHEAPVGAAATKALATLNAHYEKEEKFVLPPLGLLPRIANGEISKDMAPAIAMALRTQAALPELQNDHIQITSLMNELIEAGNKSHNDELVRLATRIAAQSLNHIEVLIPASIMVGNYLRQRLPKDQHSSGAGNCALGEKTDACRSDRNRR
jgi:hypothetical protein